MQNLRFNGRNLYRHCEPGVQSHQAEIAQATLRIPNRKVGDRGDAS